jgi:PAS domain S-box-containing protein
MLGYSHDEILGMTVSDVLVPDEAPRVAGEVARLRGGDAVKSEWHFRRKDGSTFYGEVNGRRLADSRLLGYVRDISQRKRTERCSSRACWTATPWCNKPVRCCAG